MLWSHAKWVDKVIMVRFLQLSTSLFGRSRSFMGRRLVRIGQLYNSDYYSTSFGYLTIQIFFTAGLTHSCIWI